MECEYHGRTHRPRAARDGFDDTIAVRHYGSQSHHVCPARRDHLPRELRLRVFLLAWMVGLDTGTFGREPIAHRGCRRAGATPTRRGTVKRVVHKSSMFLPGPTCPRMPFLRT